NKLESNALASSSSSESSSSLDNSSNNSSSEESDIDTNNSDTSSDRETTSSSNLTSTGENTSSSTPSKQPTPPTSNGGNSSTKPTPPTPPPTPPTPPAPTPPPPPTPPTVAQRTWEYMPSLSRQTFDLMNKFRQDNGVVPLKWNETCNGRAKKQAESNAIRQGIQHGGGQIALNNSTGTAESFIKQWANSPDHKNAMLSITNQATDMAVAVYKDSNGRFYVIADMTNDFWG
ncbi:MAG: CAP domain-containing protein, partial [Oscillospiraceae bacterium]|nr:CAP domain-containing protein [Oscillospiraceae bacterium]